MDKRFDVIIVGSGAGGGTLARQLAPSGKSILVLERGDWLKREAENWDATAVFVQNRYVSPETWYDRNGRAFQPQVHYFVGGATKMFGAALYRLRREDFGELRRGDILTVQTGGAIMTASPRPGRSPMRNWSRITPAPSRCTTSMGCGGMTRPSRPPADPIPARRFPTSRAFNSCSTT